MTALAIAPATLADLERHPGRCELIDGEIIEMAPAGFEHALVVNRIGFLLESHRQRAGLDGCVLAGDPGFILDERHVRAPDVAYLTADRMATAPARGFMPFVPSMAVEVVSPGDAWSDVKQKARMWLDHGVRLVWVVDPISRTVEVLPAGKPVVEFNGDDRLDGGDVLPGFSCAVSDCFR
jgi:Uma2 family endonuclease